VLYINGSKQTQMWVKLWCAYISDKFLQCSAVTQTVLGGPTMNI